MEDVDLGTNPAVTDYAIGARGIDAISKTVGSNTVVVYPIYDSHGNMMADVSRNGSGGFNVNDKRSYDAWGNIRSGASTGDPKGRYCADLGHVQDDESGLIYMRARYYEPTAGRFISEDGDRSGLNQFAYCENSPVGSADESGNDPQLAIAFFLGIIGCLISLFDCYMEESGSNDSAQTRHIKEVSAAITGFMSGFASAFGVWIGAGAVAIQAGITDLVSQVLSRGLAGVHWGEVAADFGIGGALGIAFGALGAIAGENAQISQELIDDGIDPGGIAGGWAASAWGDAANNALFN